MDSSSLFSYLNRFSDMSSGQAHNQSNFIRLYSAVRPHPPASRCYPSLLI